MTKTTIFLDVDGVINAISEGYPKQNTGWTDWGTGRVSFQELPSSTSGLLAAAEPKNGFRITYARDLLRRLEALASRDDIEIIWLTTWCDDARTHLCPVIELDGADWTVLGKTDYESWIGGGWWKFVALRRWWESHDRTDHRVVWLDDDIRYAREARPWIESLGSQILAISPQSLHGLTVKHLEKIEEFCS